MKILVLSNFYPPEFIGGYEIGCKEIVDRLRSRGHELQVLTSNYSRNPSQPPQDQPGVWRWLEHSWEASDEFPKTLISLGRRERANRRALNKALDEFKPDSVYIWNLGYVSLSMLKWIAQRNLPTAFYLSDYWLADWKSGEVQKWFHHPYESPLKRAVMRGAAFVTLPGFRLTDEEIDYSTTQFTSGFVKRATQDRGKPVDSGAVINWGVEIEDFPFREGASCRNRLLFVGRLTHEKGIETAIKAVGRMKALAPDCEFSFTIAGSGEEAYISDLKTLVDSADISEETNFTGQVTREQIKALYQQHDILVFASEWDEPFSISLVEGLSAGLAAVATNTGGSPEIAIHEESALVFEPGDAEMCARHLLRLRHDAILFERIRANARQSVVSRFRIGAMVDAIELSLGAGRQNHALKLEAAAQAANPLPNLKTERLR